MEIGNGVFIGHGVMFVNDNRPAAVDEGGGLIGPGDWTQLRTIVDDRASIGSGALLLGGIRIGAGAIVGAGAVVTRDVAPGATVAGVPARVLRDR